MPKLKHAPSSYSLSQAKKCKKTQREDPVKRQQESIRRQLRSSNSRCREDPEERRRQQNTETHRTACLDPERRQEEQERNTAVRQQVRIENLDTRRVEQERDTVARRLSCEDPAVRME